MIGEDLAFVAERPLGEMQGELEGLEHLGAARVADEPVDVLKGEARGLQDLGHPLSDIGDDEAWDRAVEDDAEAVRIDPPAHDLQSVGPGVLAGAANGADAVSGRRDHAGGRSVAEEGGGDDIGAGKLIEPERQGAELEADHQHPRSGIGLGQAGGEGKAGHPAGASQAKHRHARDIGTKTHPRRGPRLEARRGDAGGGHGDDRVDLICANAGALQGQPSGGDEELQGAIEVGLGPLRPGPVLEVPLQRHGGLAPLDAAVAEDRIEAVEVAVALGEEGAGPLGDSLLLDDVGRGSRGERDQLDGVVQDSPPFIAPRRFFDRDLAQGSLGASCLPRALREISLSLAP